MDSQQLETKSKDLFSGLRSARVEASPFLKTRVMARIRENETAKREVWVWRALTATSMALCVSVVWWHMDTQKKNSALLADAFNTQQNYVIQIDLGGDRLKDARVAEVDLPDGVRFVSKTRPEVSELRNMRLPITEVDTQRSRLPFVVSSETSGRKELKLRILDEEGSVIQERVLSVNFVARGKQGKM